MTQPSLFRVAAHSMRLMGGAVFLAVGMVFILIAGNALLTEHRYQTAAKDLTAVVVVKNLRRATSNTSTAHEITYRVSPVGQPAFERTEVVPVGTWDALEPGSGIQVQYVAGDPGSARVFRPPSAWPPASYRHTRCGTGARWRLARCQRPSHDAGVRSNSDRAKGRVWMRTMKGSFWVWFGAIRLAVGLPFVLIGALLAVDERRFETEGRLVEAMGKNLTKGIRHVTYRFDTPHRQRFEGHGDVPEATWNALTERGPIQVVYLPDPPASSCIAGESKRMLLALFAFLGGFLSLMGGTILVAALRSARTKRARTAGERRSGRGDCRRGRRDEPPRELPHPVAAQIRLPRLSEQAAPRNGLPRGGHGQAMEDGGSQAT